MNTEEFLARYDAGQRDFLKSSLRNLSIRDRILEDVFLNQSDLVFSNFSKLTIESTDFSKSNLQSANFLLVNFLNSDLSDANCSNASFRGVSIKNTNLRGASQSCKTQSEN
ncbi:pentapeptide repeat-containing protein [Baaleninema simplex]|uniref:pentapeptide repeat-containing protein n=1 Tax=Baaleninema simplex TaxID=2862350 RepID=UPI0003481D5C|nr:pentapeptide repeat-containing protein [Baaleninema simplex]